MIDRRTFFGLLAGGGVVATHAAAQRDSRGPVGRIAIVLLHGEGDPEGQARIATFRSGLDELGWVEGRNLRLDVRWGGGDPTRARAVAEELAALAPDVIVANGTTPLAALQRQTKTIPLVFAVVTDPVGAGFVPSLSRPGGNITGFSTFEPEIGGKWLGLLREAVPGLRRVGVILDPGFTGFAGIWHTIERTAASLGISAAAIPLRQAADDLEGAVTKFAEMPGGGLIVLPTSINNVARERIFSLAAKHRLPALYPFRLYATSGGLMSYGFDPQDLLKRSAAYVDRILKGAVVGELPVQAPTKFDFVINQRTAKTLGLAIPPAVLLQATEVLE